MAVGFCRYGKEQAIYRLFRISIEKGFNRADEDNWDCLWGWPHKDEYKKATQADDSPEHVLQWGLGDAAPGDDDYDGGRWITHHVTLNNVRAGRAYNKRSPIKSKAELREFVIDQNVSILLGSWEFETTSGPPDFFSCPLERL